MKGKRTMRYRKKGFRKTRKQRAGFIQGLFGSDEPNNQQKQTSNVSSQDKKQYGSISSGVTSAVKASSRAWNFPAALSAINSKLNALLIHNKVNYKFSNGYNARDYSLLKESGSDDNDGRGILNPGAKRGVITGFQSKVYNIGTDTYAASKKKTVNQPINKQPINKSNMKQY